MCRFRNKNPTFKPDAMKLICNNNINQIINRILFFRKMNTFECSHIRNKGGLLLEIILLQFEIKSFEIWTSSRVDQ